MRSWVIGSRADCDVVVDSPLASARHCQLTQAPDGYVLEDLGTTNGTYVNGLLITVATRVTFGDEITLGRTVAMQWPPGVMRSISIGRLPDNDVVFDDPRVSGHHARLIVALGCETLIEDLGSSNGTFLNSADRRVTKPTPLTATDTLYFGTLSVPAARLLFGLKEPETAVPPPFPTKTVREPHSEPAPGRRAIALPLGSPWAAVLLAQAPVLAILVVLVFGRHAAAPITAASWASVRQGIAATTYALALAAIGLGCSTAVLESAAGRSPHVRASVDSTGLLVSLGSRLAVLIALCAVECTVLLAIVYWGSGLLGPWLAMWGLLAMASTVGLLLGLVITALFRTWQTAAAVSLACFVPMVALGGRIWPLPTMNPAVGMATAAMPSRWAWEGLLLLESAHHPAPLITGGSDISANRDLAEDYFPADSEQMGPRADAMALGSMLIGLAAAAAFISGKPKSDP